LNTLQSAKDAAVCAQTYIGNLHRTTKQPLYHMQICWMYSCLSYLTFALRIDNHTQLLVSQFIPGLQKLSLLIISLITK